MKKVKVHTERTSSQPIEEDPPDSNSLFETASSKSAKRGRKALPAGGHRRFSCEDPGLPLWSKALSGSQTKSWTHTTLVLRSPT